jgi:hypothetical protein
VIKTNHDYCYGFAAALAESLWLSGRQFLFLRLRRCGGTAAKVKFSHGKPEAFRKDSGQAVLAMI